jgi:hypothetical protein
LVPILPYLSKIAASQILEEAVIAGAVHKVPEPFITGVLFVHSRGLTPASSTQKSRDFDKKSPCTTANTTYNY